MSNDTSPSALVATATSESAGAVTLDRRPGWHDALRAHRPQSMSEIIRTVWFLPAAATGALGLWHASSVEIWLDELTSVNVASRSWSQILATIRHIDAVHGAFYLFLHLWISLFGHSLLVMRLPGIVATVAAAICVAVTGQRLFGWRAGFAAGAFFALTPAVSRYATELRSYPFVAFAAALSTLLLIRALEQPTRRRWAGYAIALAAAGTLNLVAFAILSGHAVGVFAHTYRTKDQRVLRVRRFATAAIAAVSAASPVIYLGLRQVKKQIGGTPRPTLHDLYLMGPEMVCSVLGAGILLGIGAVALGSSKARAAVLAGATAFLPVLVIWTLSRYGGQSYFYFARYLLFCVPAIALLAGAGAATIRGSRATLAILLVFAVAVLPDQQAVHGKFAHSWYNYPDAAFPPRDYLAAAQAVERQYHAGDAGVFGGQIDIDEGVNFYLPSDMQLRNLLALRTPAQNNSIYPQYCSNIQRCLGDQRRIWLILPVYLPNPADGLTPAQALVIKHEYHVVSVDHVTGLTVTLLTRG